MFALFLYHPQQLISKELLIYLALQDTKTKSQISKTQRFGFLLYVRLIGVMAQVKRNANCIHSTIEIQFLTNILHSTFDCAVLSVLVCS